MESSVPGLVAAAAAVCGMEKPPTICAKQVCSSKKVTDHHAIVPTICAEKVDMASLPLGEREVLKLAARGLCDNLTPVGNLRLVTPSMASEDAAKALCAIGLSDCLTQPARELSGGMRRRVAILRALLADYDFLLLDEPFKGLDEKTKANVIFDTRRRCNKRTVLMVTHDKDELSAMGAVQTINL